MGLKDMGFIQKHMKGFLVVSVLVNILLIGMVGGHVYKKWSSHPWHEVKAQLSPESRNVVGRTFQSAVREGRPIADEARKARAESVCEFGWVAVGWRFGREWQ